MAQQYLYDLRGQPHGYFEKEMVLDARTAKPLYYRERNYLFAYADYKAVAYQDGDWFFDPKTGRQLWYIA
jgi:hypothetical protein